MYPYNNTFLEDWNKTIIYAPNGFGKTTNSLKLSSELRNRGKKVKFFTHNSLKDLMDEFDNEFYVGLSAKLQSQKANLEMKLDEIKPLVNGVGANTFAATKGSFVLSYYEVKKSTDRPHLIKKKIDKLRKKYSDYTDNDLYALDRVLDYRLFFEIESFLTKHNAYEKIEIEEINELYVNEEIQESIYSLYLYSKFNGFKNCLLCGKTYKSTKSLIKSIEKHLSEIKIENSEDAYRELNMLVLKLARYIKKSNNFIINRLFGGLKNNSTNKKFLFIKLYRALCMDIVYLLSNKIGEIQTKDGDSVFSIYRRLDKIEAEIEKIDGNNEKNKAKINKFNNFLIGEIKSIIHTDGDVVVEALKNKKGFVFKINNKKIDAKKILSTSEFKRLILVILYVEIKTSDVDTLILDDPIDSYDDYTKLIAIKYIKKILLLRRLHNWYILTNDFECVYHLSELQKCDALFYLPDPDYVFQSSTFRYWSQRCDYKEVRIIGKNDLYFLVNFLATDSAKYNFNPEIMFCALTLPLRNLNSEVVKKIKNLNITTSKLIIDKEWCREVNDIIVSCFEHYRHDSYLNGSTVERSSNLSVSKIAELYCRLNSNSNFPSILLFNSDNAISYRKTLVKQSFSCIRGNGYASVINYLFFKALMIETIKYEFEEKIINKGYLTFSSSTMDKKLKKANGLQSIINSLKDLNRKTPSRNLDLFVKKCQKIHDDYAVLYNSVDHATTMMIAPYLSISVREIKAFKNEVLKI